MMPDTAQKRSVTEAESPVFPRQWVERMVAQITAPTVLAITIPAPVADPLGWIIGKEVFPAVYWRAPNGAEFAGLGQVHEISAVESGVIGACADEAVDFLRHRVHTHGAPAGLSPQFVGGFAFDPMRPGDGDWIDNGFTSARLVLPEAVYHRCGDRAWLSLAMAVMPGITLASIMTQWDQLQSRYRQDFTAPANTKSPFSIRLSAGGRDRWQSNVESALGAIGVGDLQKIVLARRARMVTGYPLDPWTMTDSLRAANPGCYQFAFAWNEEAAFIGSTPERLFQLAGRQITCECMAGTVRRGNNSRSDESLATGLLASDKERREHAFVVEAVLDQLESVCERLDTIPQPRVVQLSTLQHLSCPVEGQLNTDATIGDILTRLHPTPAVGGWPRSESLEMIRALEPHSRGWYAGPVGWIGADDAEFCVAIRSALIYPDGGWAYAGAGIVTGSVPEDEWQETSDKLRALTRAVNAGPRSV
jgi:isochorismate synthase